MTTQQSTDTTKAAEYSYRVRVESSREQDMKAAVSRKKKKKKKRLCHLPPLAGRYLSLRCQLAVFLPAGPAIAILPTQRVLKVPRVGFVRYLLHLHRL